MKKILYIVLFLVILVAVFLVRIIFFPSQSIKDIEEIQATLVESGFHDTLREDFREYNEVYIKALESIKDFDLENQLDLITETKISGEELMDKLSFIKERIEAKSVTTETAGEMKRLSLEIIEGVNSYLFLTGNISGSYGDDDVKIASRVLRDTNEKISEFATIVNKYF